MLFEHILFLKILKTGHSLFTWHLEMLSCCPGISRLSKFLLGSKSVSFCRIISLFLAYFDNGSYDSFSFHFS